MQPFTLRLQHENVIVSIETQGKDKIIFLIEDNKADICLIQEALRTSSPAWSGKAIFTTPSYLRVAEKVETNVELNLKTLIDESMSVQIDILNCQLSTRSKLSSNHKIGSSQKI